MRSDNRFAKTLFFATLSIGAKWRDLLMEKARLADTVANGLNGSAVATAAANYFKIMNNAPMLAHMVYFSLNDNSAAQKEKLVRECDAYLKDHPGIVFFAVGTLAENLQRPVNVRDFDVSLHLVFKTGKDQDAYQTAPRHLEFIERNKANWKQVRVFDSVIR